MGCVSRGIDGTFSKMLFFSCLDLAVLEKSLKNHLKMMIFRKVVLKGVFKTFLLNGKDGALRSRNWGRMKRKGNHFRGWGKLEGEIQLSFSIRESLQPKACLAALLQEICHLGELVIGKSVGSRGPRSLRGHGRWSTCGYKDPWQASTQSAG